MSLWLDSEMMKVISCFLFTYVLYRFPVKLLKAFLSREKMSMSHRRKCKVRFSFFVNPFVKPKRTNPNEIVGEKRTFFYLFLLSRELNLFPKHCP